MTQLQLSVLIVSYPENRLELVFEHRTDPSMEVFHDVVVVSCGQHHTCFSENGAYSQSGTEDFLAF